MKNKYPADTAMLYVPLSQFLDVVLVGSVQYDNLPKTSDVCQITYSCDFKTIMGDLFYKFTHFNIKLEAINSALTGQLVAGQEYSHVLHIDGLPWTSNYLDYGSSFLGRVLETFSTAGAYDIAGDAYRGTHFISNCNGLMFRRPIDPLITLRFFFTRVQSNDVFIPFNKPNMMLSITGVTGFETERRLIPRAVKIPRVYQSSFFTLTCRNENALDTNNNVWRFNNFNLRNAIGASLFDNYDSFVLVTRLVQDGTRIGLLDLNNVTQTIEQSTGSALNSNTYSMSGLKWKTTSYPPYNRIYTSNVRFMSPSTNYHLSTPVMIDIINLSATPSLSQNIETFIPNVFRKTTDLVTLTIQTHTLLTFNVPTLTNANAYAPAMLFYFEVYPHIN